MGNKTVLDSRHAVTSSWITSCSMSTSRITSRRQRKPTRRSAMHVNKYIQDMLTGFGFGKCKVKAVALSPLKEQPGELDKVYGRLKTKETDEAVYYVQEFKISCADEEYSHVLEFLRTDEYRIRNIFLKDIDVTKDYSGSFDKDEVIHHLTTIKGFRMQGCATDADGKFWTILTKLVTTALHTWKQCKA